MPKTLDETYERALLEIDEETREHAQRLFQCLAVSIRPLRVEELAEILAVQFDAETFPEFNPDWRLGDAGEAVLSVCSNLISVVDVDGCQVVQFSHFSVREFLSSDRLAGGKKDLSGYHIVPHSAHTILAQASLCVLLQLDDRIDTDSIKNFPLSRYAAEHWVDHCQFEGVSSTIQVAMERLFDPNRPHFSAWVWIHDIDDPWRGNMHTRHPNQPGATPLYYAVLCGFRNLIGHLLATYPGDVNTRGGYHESPLFAAVIKEDIDTTLLLLRQGADVNVLSNRGVSPLCQACEGGRIDIVRLLLENNADVNLQNDFGATPLSFASIVGETGVLRLLLQWGANVNSQAKDGNSPLHVVAQCGHLDAVRLLIESGANIDPHTKLGQTPLHLASYFGHAKLAELLIQHGADMSFCDNGGFTSLNLASKEGHVELAKLLIQHGADVGSRSKDGSTPLHSVSRKGHVKLAELLIQLGADVGSRDNAGFTPLHSASQEGHVKLAELLVQGGAHVGSRSKRDTSPLHLAARKGHLDIVKLLLGSGADPNIRNDNNKTPLDLASNNDKLDSCFHNCRRLQKKITHRLQPCRASARAKQLR